MLFGFATLVGLLAAPLATRPALAALRAEAELGYVDYQVDADGVKSSATSFAQRYSVLYNTGGILDNRRTNPYRLALGYEWAGMSTKLDLPGQDQKINLNAGHILYMADVRYLAQNLPLFFRLYSQDMHRTTFDTYAERYINLTDPVINPNLPVNLFGGGSRISNGGLLILGSRAVAAAGQDEPDVWDDFPQLTVRFRNTIARDLTSLNPQDFTEDSFQVSLNKGVNYLHFMQNRMRDHLTPSQDFSERRYIVGNVDAGMNRTWINLTNWIKVSADGQYSMNSGQTSLAPVEYSTHVFAKLDRGSWNGTLFSSLIKSVYSDRITYNSNNPLYVRGDAGVETDWQSSLNYRVTKDVTPTSLINYRSEATSTLRVTTLKRSMFTITPRVLLESIEDNTNRALILDTSLEAASTRRYSDRLSLVGSYGVRLEKDDGSVDDSSAIQTLVGRAIYNGGGRYKADLTQALVVGTGTRPAFTSGLVTLGASGDISLASFTNPPAGFQLSVTTLRGDWNITPRLSAAVWASGALRHLDGGANENIATFRSDVHYSGSLLRARATLGYNIYNVADREGWSEFLASGNLSYVPNRNVTNEVELLAQKRFYKVSEGDTYIRARQLFTYAFYPTSGEYRKLLDFSEMFLQETSLGRSKTSLILGTTYYPLQRLYLSANARYSLRQEPEHDSEYAGSGEIGITYSKLQASLNYSYGRRSDNRVEKRLAANMKKQF